MREQLIAKRKVEHFREMEGAAVKLIIKAPNQQIKDQIVQCDMGWTIGRLKEYLSEVYPSKPESKNQKLIYSGQLLTDSTCLKDVLRQCEGQEDQSYTVHLVCAPQKTCANTSASGKVQSIENSNTEPNIRNNAGNARLSAINNVQNQSLDNSNITVQHMSAQLFSTQYFEPHNNQQVAWMQQAYTYYFTQYMQLMAAQGIQLQTGIPYIQQMNVNSSESAQNPYLNNVNSNAEDEQQQPATQDTPENANAEDNDGAGEEGAFNPDWLDFFYMFSEIGLLFSIAYFHLSPLRFLIVTLMGFVIYLHQRGFIRVQPVVPENNNARAENNNQILQNEANGARGAGIQQNGQTQGGQTEARTNANSEIEEERPGALAVTWTFFSSFFTSLIPDGPDV